MKNSIKTTVTAILLSTVAIVPAVSISLVATADAAYAKSDNAGGNGKSEDRGNSGSSNGNGGKSAEAKSKSGSSSSSASSNGKKGGLGGFFAKLTGQDKKAARATSAPQAVKVSKKADPMHPSNLGNMNGAMNANINAVLAHIRNGNTNGPVGMLAGLAVANINAEGAQDIIDLNGLFDDLASALGEGGTVEGYYQSLTDAYEGARNADVEAALTTLETDPTNADALQILADNGYGGSADPAGDYEQSLADAREAARDPVVESAIAALGGDPVAGTDITETPPTEEEVAEAEENLQARTDAELAILDSWNKNPDSTEEITTEEQDLLNKLYERLAAEDAAIRDAMGIEEASSADTCVLEEGCEGSEEVMAEATE